MSVELKPISKTELIEQLRRISQRLWREHKTHNTSDGAGENIWKDLGEPREQNVRSQL